MDKELEEKLKQLSIEELLKLLVEKMGYDFSKENIIAQKAKNYVKKREKLYTGYLKGFDKEFRTHISMRMKETPLLRELFNAFIEEIYRPSKIHQLSNSICIKIEEDLNRSLNKKQKKLFSQWKFCEDIIANDLAEQSFIYGYAMSTEFREEAEKQYPYKENE